MLSLWTWFRYNLSFPGSAWERERRGMESEEDLRMRSGLSILSGFLFVAMATAGEARLEKTDLFEAGKGGYKLYRIPGIVVTAQGSVLAYCEARKHSGLDWDDIRILV